MARFADEICGFERSVDFRRRLQRRSKEDFSRAIAFSFRATFHHRCATHPSASQTGRGVAHFCFRLSHRRLGEAQFRHRHLHRHLEGSTAIATTRVRLSSPAFVQSMISARSNSAAGHPGVVAASLSAFCEIRILGEIPRLDADAGQVWNASRLAAASPYWVQRFGHVRTTGPTPVVRRKTGYYSRPSRERSRSPLTLCECRERFSSILRRWA